ncbi:tyrosine-type recombinase/integrase [Streptomyces hirsutus]|uniref:tyrosine-type recombinase/integrase n=1 Tax=Streptomyces hirsutus TaxID=35620 RepID=UPI003F4D8371
MIAGALATRHSDGGRAGTAHASPTRPLRSPKGTPRRQGPGPGRLWLHDLRHCAATLSLAAGLHMKAIQKLLGHSSYSLTADTYTSVLPQSEEAQAEAPCFGSTQLTSAAGRHPGTGGEA